MQISTNELMNQLNSSNNIEDYLNKNEALFNDTSLADYLYNMFDEKCLKKNKVFAKAEIAEVYGYQILGGKKHPSRNVTLALCIGAGFTLNETQVALQIGKYSSLSPKDKRDSIIIFGINSNQSVVDINLKLYEKKIGNTFYFQVIIISF